MIRIIAKRLIDIGRGKLSVDDFRKILEGEIVPREITIAYPQGLFLTRVKYPFLNISPSEEVNAVFQISTMQSWNEV